MCFERMGLEDELFTEKSKRLEARASISLYKNCVEELSSLNDCFRIPQNNSYLD